MTSTPTPLPTWSAVEFSPNPAIGRHIVGTPTEGGAVLAQMTEPGDGVVSWTPVDGVFQSAGSSAPGGSQTDVGDVAVMDGTGFAIATERDFEGRPAAWSLWSSTDGVGWTRSTPGGLETASALRSISATPHGLFLGGAVGDRADAPALWHSSDGVSWRQLPTPPRDEPGLVVDVVMAGEQLFALVSDPAAVWISADGGQTWASVELPVPEGQRWSLDDAAALGSVVVAVGGAHGVVDELLVLASSDLGASWQRMAVVPTPHLSERLTPRVVGAAGAWWIATWHQGPVSAHRDPASCYGDLHACQSRPMLLHSTDAVAWTDVDLGFGGRWFVGNIIDANALGVLVLGSAGGPQWSGWTWARPSAPPARPATPPADTEQHPLVGHTDPVAVGVTYRYPLGLHCGLRVLGNFDGRWWWFTESPAGLSADDGARDLPAGWPVAEGEEYLFGLITRTDEDTIDYHLPTGERVAVYTASDEVPPGCA